MAKKKGILGKIVDAVTEDDEERKAREASGQKHGGLLGAIEDRVMPDTPEEKRQKEMEKQQRASQ